MYFSDTLFRLTRREPLKVCLHLTGRSERGIITGVCFGCPSSGFKVNHVEGARCTPAPCRPVGGSSGGAEGSRSNDLHPTWESELPVSGLLFLSVSSFNIFVVWLRVSSQINCCGLERMSAVLCFFYLFKYFTFKLN